MPRLKGTPLVYLQQILSNRKRYFKRSEINDYKIPLWPELSVGKTWPFAAQHPEFLHYMPDGWTASKKTERTFFWAVLCKL